MACTSRNSRFEGRSLAREGARKMGWEGCGKDSADPGKPGHQAELPGIKPLPDSSKARVWLAQCVRTCVLGEPIEGIEQQSRLASAIESAVGVDWHRTRSRAHVAVAAHDCARHPDDVVWMYYVGP